MEGRAESGYHPVTGKIWSKGRDPETEVDHSKYACNKRRPGPSIMGPKRRDVVRKKNLRGNLRGLGGDKKEKSRALLKCEPVSHKGGKNNVQP